MLRTGTGDTITSLRLRADCRMANQAGKDGFAGARGNQLRLRRGCGVRTARTFFRNRFDSGCGVACLSRARHHAVMFATFAAACWKAQFARRCNKRLNNQPAKQQHQNGGDTAVHRNVQSSAHRQLTGRLAIS